MVLCAVPQGVPPAAYRSQGRLAIGGADDGGTDDAGAEDGGADDAGAEDDDGADDDGGELDVLPPLQATPLSVNDVGAGLLPFHEPLNPKAVVPPEGILPL